MGWGYDSSDTALPSKQEALNSNPSAAQKTVGEMALQEERIARTELFNMNKSMSCEWVERPSILMPTTVQTCPGQFQFTSIIWT
jgi:hypothetical protein